MSGDSSTEVGVDSVIAELREEISATDDKLLSAVNRRLELARRMFEHKEASGIPILDAGREDAMVARLAAANPGPLTAEGVEGLFRYVLELTKRELGRG